MPTKAKVTADPLMQATEQYLQQHYCTLQYLLKTCDLTEAEFFAYVDEGCLPRHSYEWQAKNVVSSFLGKQDWVNQSILYYHPRHILLLHDLITWHRFMSFEDMAKALKEDFKVHYIAQLKELDAFSDVLCDCANEPAALDTFLEAEWQGYLEGTYGLCVNEPTAENIATKETMLRRIRLLTANGNKETLRDEERVLLKEAIQTLDLILSPFAPYERARSSRELWLNAIVAKYALS
jgi:Family of unknown function (DUF6058)